MLCPGCAQDVPSDFRFCNECGARLDVPGKELVSDNVLISEDFVGRQREMGELVAALDDALSGQGRLVMLAGEPGIGKTRLAQELAAISEERGAQVMWGRCYEGEGAPPYWPWVQLIRAYIQDREPEDIASVMDAGAADIAEIIPQLRHKLPDLQPSPSLEPEAARFRLFDSVTTFLKKASESQPLVLILDNLHWADRTSLLLLEFLAPELEHSHILVLGTYRDVDVSRRHPLSQTLGVLIREQLFQRVQLRGMTLEEVRRFIEITSEGSVPSDVVYAVHSRTEGNPLFVTEVVRLLKQEGFEEVEGLDVRIPEGIRDAIGRRLSGLSEGCNEVLTTASVIGREFSLTQLERLVDGPSTSSGQGLSEDELLEAIEEAAGAYVIEEVEGGIGTYRFTHALIQQTLAGELSTTRRVRTHARIAEALEEIYANDLESHAEELAHHYAEAATMTGPGKMVHYSLVAGEQALATYAYEDAQAHFERALTAKEGQGTDAETAALLFDLGKAQVATLERHRMQEALESLARAFDYYADVGDVTQAVAVADRYPVPPLAPLGGVTPLLARALELVAPDSHEAGRLLSRYGNAVGALESNYEAAREVFDRALAIAQLVGDTQLEVQTLVNAARVDGYHLHWQESLKKSLRAIELLGRVDDPGSEVPARFWATSALLILGDLQGAREHASAALAPAERLRHRFGLAIAYWSIGPVARMQGDWEAAREFINRGLAIDPQEMIFHAQRALIEYEVGDFRQGKLHLDETLDILRLIPMMNVNTTTFPAVAIPMIARISGVGTGLEVVKAAAEDILSYPFTAPLTAIICRAAVALVAVFQKDVEAAKEQYEVLKSVRVAEWWGAAMTTDRLLGLLAHTMGRLDQAVTHFEDGLAFCRKGGYRPELAWTCSDYADALLQRASAGSAQTHDRAKAMVLLDESLAISTELGMQPLMERVLSIRERAESQPAKAAAYPDGLSQREVEVLRLLHLGKSNREISQELFISLSTVAHHVSSIFNKTDVSNRTEAASYAARHSLVP